jgi:hypothetical protein
VSAVVIAASPCTGRGRGGGLTLTVAVRRPPSKSHQVPEGAPWKFEHLKYAQGLECACTRHQIKKKKCIHLVVRNEATSLSSVRCYAAFFGGRFSSYHLRPTKLQTRVCKLNIGMTMLHGARWVQVASTCAPSNTTTNSRRRTDVEVMLRTRRSESN